MFRYDKDMERVMQAKKFEILKELEDCKLRILKELSGVDKVTLTRLRELLADYNKIEHQITTRITNIETKVNSNLITIEEGLTEINDIKEQFSTAFTDVEDMKKSVEEFSTKLSTMERDVTLVNTGMGSLNEAINKNSFDIEQLSNTVDKMKLKDVSLTTTNEWNSTNYMCIWESQNNDPSNPPTTHSYQRTHHYKMNFSETEFKTATGYSIKDIVSLIGVSPIHQNGGSGFSFVLISMNKVTDTDLHIIVRGRNNGNLTDIAKNLTLRFLVIDNKDII